MKQYDDDFLKYIDEIETEMPRGGKKEIGKTYNLTMKKAGLKRNTPSVKKGIRVLLIAAAIAACTVVTAAAYGFGIGDLFKGYFEQQGSKGEAGQEIQLNESQVKKIDEAGTILNGSQTDNGTTVNIRAAVGDKNSAYILFDVIAPEGTVLDRDDYEFEDMPIDFNQKFDKFAKPVSGAVGSSISWNLVVMKDKNKTDNMKSFVIKIVGSGIDFQNREIRMTLKNLSAPKGKLTYTPVLEGKWDFTVKLAYDNTSKDITVNKVSHYGDDHATVQSIVISSLSANVTYTNLKLQREEKVKDIRVPDLVVHFKDGKKITVLSGPDGGGLDKFIATYAFDSPLDLSSVSSITLGDLEIPVQ